MNLAVEKEEIPNVEPSQIALAYHEGHIAPRRLHVSEYSAAFNAAGKNTVFYSFPRKVVPQLRRTFDASQQPFLKKSDSERWQTYLSNLTDDPVSLSPEYAKSIRIVWSKLTSLVENIQPPAAAPGGDLGFQLAWNTTKFYLDVDIAPDGHFEWFFSDKRTKLELGSEDDLLTEPPEELVRLLVKVCLDR